MMPDTTTYNKQQIADLLASKIARRDEIWHEAYLEGLRVSKETRASLGLHELNREIRFLRNGAKRKQRLLDELAEIEAMEENLGVG
jgi:hypothetical protein